MRQRVPALHSAVLTALTAALVATFPSTLPARAAGSDAASTRIRAAALLDNGEDAKAIEAFRDLTRRYPDSAPDRVNLAIALISHNDLDGAEAELRAALTKDPNDLRAHYNLGLVMKKRGKNEEGAKEMALVAGSPEGAKDATVWYQLGLLNKRLRKSDDALAAFRKAVALRPDHGSAHFQIYNELVQRGDKAAAQPELDEFKVLQKATPEFQRNEAYLERGAFTRIAAPGAVLGSSNKPEGSQPAAATIRFELRGTAANPKAKGDSGEASLAERMKDPWMSPSAALADFDGDGLLDIAVVGVSGRVLIFRNGPAGSFSKIHATLEAAGTREAAAAGASKKNGPPADEPPGPIPDIVSLAAADCDNDGDVDLLVASGEGVRLFLNQGKGAFTDATKSAGLADVAGAAGAVWTDVDRDGDLDLVLGGLGIPRTFGLAVVAGKQRAMAPPRLFLNAGLYPGVGVVPAAAPGRVSFIPAGVDAVLPRAGESVAAADMRGTGDPDLLFGDAYGPYGVAHNRRGGRFAFDEQEGVDGEGRVQGSVAAIPHGANPAFPPRLLMGDLDGDGFADLLAETIYWNNGAGLFPGGRQAIAPDRGGTDGTRRILASALIDADGDGLLDVAAIALLPAGGGAEASSPSQSAPEPRFLLLRSEGARAFTRIHDAVTLPRLDLQLALVSGDLDGDGDPDLAFVTADAPPIVLANVTKTANRWMKVALKGGKTNRSGLGARVEVRADRLFAARESDGNPTIVGIGPRGRADAVRVVWTSGVTQDLIDVPAGPVKIEEKREFSGSCPFLYAWDGAAFRFVGEALSGAPIGFLRPDGAYESPRPTEHLRLPRGLPAARGGRFSLRMAEEMRELTALDDVRLVAVDHPANVEVYSNERLTEKVEAFRYVAVADLKPPAEAREYAFGGATGDGAASGAATSDATTPLAALDDRAAAAFPTLGPRLEGLAAPHVLDMTFAAPPPSPSSRLALVLDGWVAWTTSDVSRALLQAGALEAKGNAGGAAADGASGAAVATFAGLTPPPAPGPWGPALELRASSGAVAAVGDLGLPIGPSMLVPLPDLAAGAAAAGSGTLNVRIATGLAVYYDRVRLGRVVDVPLTVRELAPVEATLHWRGVAAVRRARDDEATRPDYDAVSSQSPFPRLDEETTPPGDVLSLVTQADGRVAVYGTGDEVALEFDAGAIPPPAPGTARTWFLVSTGYARDGDPNTKPMPWKPY